MYKIAKIFLNVSQHLITPLTFLSRRVLITLIKISLSCIKVTNTSHIEI
jgi:hypothetical protein